MRGFRMSGKGEESKARADPLGFKPRADRANRMRVFAVWQNPALYSTCLGGEIGRRAGLKIPFRKECRFDSDPRHQIKREILRGINGLGQSKGHRVRYNP